MSLPALLVAQAGGVASRAELAEISDRALREEVESGRLLRPSRGVYLVPGADQATICAARSGGAISHRSAALAHGWSIWRPPPQPELILDRRRRTTAQRRRGAIARYRSLLPGDLDWVGGARVTSPVRTVLDCARDLPLIESLPVADSALRAGAVRAHEISDAVHGLPARDRPRVLAVLRQASPLAANPFESALRAISVEAVGPIFAPQGEVVVAGARLHPDLVCADLGIVLEGDSATFHTTRRQILHDCWRYDELTLAGWLVLRFAWDQVVRSPEWVAATIQRAVARRRSTSPGAGTADTALHRAAA